MKTHSNFVSAAAWVVALFALTSQAELLVYDGIPTSATPGTGTAYSAADLRTTGGVSQNPTHSSIVGETGGWTSSSGTGTGTIKANTSTNLFYPAGVNLASGGGTVDMTSGGNASDSAPNRAMGRAIANPTERLARTSFFATVLMAYDDLTGYPANAFGGWGLTRSAPAHNAYPTGGGVLMGFHKDAESSTGVSAVLCVSGAYYVIARDVAPGTHLFALRFLYSDFGEEIVSAALLSDDVEPSFAGGGWRVTVTNELLTAEQNFGWLSVGYNYNIANKHLYVDEWRVGTEWRDVAGEAAGMSYIVNAGAVSGVTPSVSGTVTKCGDPGTTVRVYYGREDGMDNPRGWETWHEFPDAATEDGQTFSFAPAGFAVSTNYFFRFSATTAAGETFAPWTGSFGTFTSAPLTFSTPSAADVAKTSVTIKGEMTDGYPAARVTACLDTVDRGTGSVPTDWAMTADLSEHEFAGVFSVAFSGLSVNADYVARFYGTNVNGGMWSEVVAFTTLAPTMTITDQYVKKGGLSIVTPVSVPVSLDTASSRPLSFRYYTSQATEANCENAVPGKHYVDESATLVIPPGVTQTNFTVRIIGNDKDEFPGRRFYVRYLDVEGAANTPGATEIGTLCDNMGRRIFYADFAAADNRWTTSASGWSISGGRYYCNQGSKNTRAGATDMKEYGLRVMNMARANNNSYQSWGIFAYNRVSEGGGSGYKFRVGNTTGSGGYNGQLHTNGVYVAGPSNGMSGSRLGWHPTMRPLSMRISITPDGHNRIRCWAGYYKAADYIDASGNFLEGGQIGLSSDGWYDTFWDNVEVFADTPARTILIVR